MRHGRDETKTLRVGAVLWIVPAFFLHTPPHGFLSVRHGASNISLDSTY